MAGAILWALVVLLSITKSYQQTQAVTILPYRCQEFKCNGATPDDAKCDRITGACLCADNENYQCTAGDGGAGCSSCHAAGGYGTSDTCVGDACLCNVGFTHDAGTATCSKSRLAITACTADQIDIEITPYSYANGDPFRGLIYLSSTPLIDFDIVESYRNCRSFPGERSLKKTIQRAGGTGSDIDCTDFEIDQSMATGDLQLWAYIQNDPDIRSPQDHYIRFQCLGTSVGPLTQSINVNDANTAGLDPLPSTFARAASGTEMRLRTRTGDRWADVDADVNVGDALSLVIEKDGRFVVRQCLVQNYAAGEEEADELKQIYFMDDWCVPDEATKLVDDVSFTDGDEGGAGAADPTKDSFRIDFKAFYFLGPSHKLYFICFMCEGGTDNCGDEEAYAAANQCSNNLINYTSQRDWAGAAGAGSRRRREIQTQNLLNTTLAVYVTVNDRDNVALGNPDLTRESTDCYKSTSVLLPIILLSGLLLITMGMTFFFCMKVTRYQEQQKLGHDNMSYRS